MLTYTVNPNNLYKASPDYKGWDVKDQTVGGCEEQKMLVIF